MKKLLLLLITFVLLPATAWAQWDFEGVFPPDSLETDGNGLHGVAVDPDGKVWLQTFGATDSVQVTQLDGAYQPTRVIYVFNPDGTEATFSPIKFVSLPGGEVDTLGGFWNPAAANGPAWEGRSGRGLRADAEGNILVSQFLTLYKLDYQTGEGLAKAEFTDYCALTQAAADDNGGVYVAPVCPGPPVRELDSDLNFISNVADVSSNFSRSILASPDGLRLYETDFENTYTIIHERADEFSAFDSVGIAFQGMRVESTAINPKTGNIWVSAGNPLNLPNQNPDVTTDWLSNAIYEFDPNTVLNNPDPQPLNAIIWEDCVNFSAEGVCQDVAGRPRGLAFSPDGETAYVVQFSQAGAVHVYTEAPFTGVERVDGELPTTIALEQNYPNPFNPTTEIEFALKESGFATLKVYDTLGREVAVLVSEALPAGTYRAGFDAAHLASGTYLYVLESGAQRVSRVMLLVK